MGAEVRQPHTPARVLLLIARPVLADLVRLALGHGAYLTQVVPTPVAAMAALQSWRPHLAIVDIDLAGSTFLDELRAAGADGRSMPIIALTRRDDLGTRLAAFEHGVDDILTVPFSPEELVARTVAVMRRSYREAVAFTPVLRLGELEIDILNRVVRASGHELHLTALEQSLLYLLAANAGRLLTRDEILDHLWGASYTAESNVVDRHVRNLRAKLQDDWQRPRYIVTVPGKGYRFLPTTAPSPGRRPRGDESS